MEFIWKDGSMQPRSVTLKLILTSTFRDTDNSKSKVLNTVTLSKHNKQHLIEKSDFGSFIDLFLPVNQTCSEHHALEQSKYHRLMFLQLALSDPAY